jgi:hypothetical protein
MKFCAKRFSGVGDAQVNALCSGFCLFSVLAGYGLATHCPLLSGDAHADADRLVMWQRRIDLVLRLHRAYPLVARLMAVFLTASSTPRLLR